MLMQFLKTQAASPDGIRVNKYMEGEVYDLPEELAVNLRRAGIARETTSIKEKAITAAPKNRMAGIPSNKETIVDLESDIPIWEQGEKEDKSKKKEKSKGKKRSLKSRK